MRAAVDREWERKKGASARRTREEKTLKSSQKKWNEARLLV